jgi:hypothetical protein
MLHKYINLLTTIIIVIIAFCVYRKTAETLDYITNFSFLPDILKRKYIKYDKDTTLELIKLSNNQTKFTKTMHNQISLWSIEFARNVTTIEAEVGRIEYKPWYDYIEKIKNFSIDYKNLVFEIYKVAELEIEINKDTALFLIKDKEDDDEIFGQKLIFGVNGTMKGHELCTNRWYNITRDFQALCYRANKLCGEAGLNKQLLTELIQASDKGWSTEKMIARYGGSALLALVPGIGIPLFVLSEAALAFYQTYDTLVTAPYLRDRYTALGARFQITEEIMYKFIGFMNEKAKFIDKSYLLASNFYSDLVHLNSNSHPIFVKSLSENIKKMNLYFETNLFNMTKKLLK